MAFSGATWDSRRGLPSPAEIESLTTEVAVVQIHPDTDSFEFHMEAVQERASRAYQETLDPTTGIEVFGEPTPRIIEMLRQAAGGGVQYRVHLHHLGGFTRTYGARSAGG